ncbi:MAG: hypothetical protein B6I25_00675, partial [Planctomycetales bacterium 4572_13]
MQHNLAPEELPDLTIDTLGEAGFDSPLKDSGRQFVDDSEAVHIYSHNKLVQRCIETLGNVPTFELAGPREKLFFDPAKLNCGIVTCGGLCPGLNDSRGPQEVDDMIDHLIKYDINLLFVIGGDGTLRGAGALAAGIKARGLSIGVVGIPKTIDNDISGIEQSFGFSTAVEEARAAIMGAHEEAKGAWNGVGMVKLMGRDSGFIAAAATLSNSDVNFCFIPEVPLTLDGEDGFLRKLEQRLDNKHHAVVVVA